MRVIDFTSIRSKEEARSRDIAKNKIDTSAFRNIEQLKKLRVDHRNLDDVIAQMAIDPTVDQLQIKRMKKERLKLKDQITRIESEMIPDLNA